MSQEDTEKDHERNIALLIKKFGSEISPEEIRDLYERHRKQLESTSKVRGYMHLILMRSVRDELSVQVWSLAKKK